MLKEKCCNPAIAEVMESTQQCAELVVFLSKICAQMSLLLNMDNERISGVLTIYTFESGRHLYSLPCLEMFQVNGRVELR